MVNTLQVEWDDVYRALSNGARRQIIQDLLDENGRMAEAALADALGQPSTVTADGGDRDQETDLNSEERVRMHLAHVHLPQLENAGLIDWNREQDVVSITQLSTNLPVGLIRPTIVHADAGDGIKGAGD